MMIAWNNGKVVGQKQWSEKLHSLYVEADIEPYKAGQFIKLALDIDGEIVGRPYSLVNPPGAQPLEFYYARVPDGALTARLVELKAGDDIRIAQRAHGFMILDEVPRSPHLWMLATGTGVGPFLSILATDEPWQRFERIVLVYAARTLAELNYRERIAHFSNIHGEKFDFVPFISREASDFALSGHIPQAIQDGRLEQRAKLPISAENSQLMLCGNPAMVKDTTQVLVERGLKKHRRTEPGQITVENYW